MSMIPQTNSYDRALHNPNECFRQGWIYPQRPILFNKKYPYKLLNVANPDDFVVQIDDRVSAIMDFQIKEACIRFKDYYINICDFVPMDVAHMKPMLPVAVRDEFGNYHRAEVKSVSDDKMRVNIYFVDSGKDKLVSHSSVFPPSIDLLRFPKLSLKCRLAQVVPFGNAKAWAGFDYWSLFKGKTGSYFSVVRANRGEYEVHLDCDAKDVGYELVMNESLGDFTPLCHNYDGEETIRGQYPRYDFADRIGQKIRVFGTKISAVGKNGHIKVHLQLDPSIVESTKSVLEKMELLPDNVSIDADKNFPKGVGDAVLVRYGVDKKKYRATIFQKSGMEYLVKLVDYGHFVKVEERDLFRINDGLLHIPEAATPCYLVELFHSDHGRQIDELEDKLVKLVLEKNLYCRIGYANYTDLEDSLEIRKCIVSLSREHDDKPFHDILNVPKVELDSYFSHHFPIVNQSLAQKLLGSDSGYFPEVKYEGIVSCIENQDSIWLQLEGDDARAEELTDELTGFYAKLKSCPQLDPTSETLVGSFVGAQPNSADTHYYRAQITEADPSNNLWKVLFLDYGNYDTIPIEKMKPLPSYFCKNKCFALEAALPVELLSGSDPEELCRTIENMTEGRDLTVYLQHEEGLTYVWIFCIKESLTNSLIARMHQITKVKITPTSGIPD